MAGTECIRIVEVGPRDGLQNLATFVATDRKTGVDLPAHLNTARRLQGILPDIPLTSALSRAGLPRRADFPCPS